MAGSAGSAGTVGADRGTLQLGGGEEASWTRLGGAGDKAQVVEQEPRLGFGCDSLGQRTAQIWVKTVTRKRVLHAD